MFHAEIRPAKTFRQIIESLKEVVNECTFECTDSQMQVQAMDSSHVSLVSLELTSDQFHSYRCEKNIQLGVSIGNLAKMIKGATNDSIILTSEDEGDVLNIRLQDSGEEKVSEFSMKLMEIDSESLGIPDQAYKAGVQLPSAEFARICRDIANFGDAVTIEVTKDHVAFSASGDIGSGKIVLKSSRNADQHGGLNSSPTLKRAKREVKDEKVKKEEQLVKVKKEKGTEASQEETNGEHKAEDDEPSTRGRKRTGMEKPSKLMNNEVSIDCKEPVTLQFALRYLTMFSKAQAVSDTVRLMIAPTVPLQVEFEINGNNDDKNDKDAPQKKLGFLRYYLAPKVGNEEENENDDFAEN
eukprot:TRINITY_DN1278_c7_g1_i1.p1 TRINITY_DN1278_c7_g1~~TRINITY_DN1278_c7_g1_i1.p1  ORF type:complete len:354 (+),score=95.59 TRINITY_DN1278_c7_g1_i1:78-1139(+)